jgi:hypothetical protein
MEKVSHEVGTDPLVRIESIGGDLRLSGREGATFEAQAPENGKLKVEASESEIQLRCKSGCLIFLPTSARVEAEVVGGDVRITGLINAVSVRKIGGDLSLRRVGKAEFGQIGGDLSAHKLEGDLSIDNLGGDAVVQELLGNMRLGNVGGDLMGSDLEGNVEASVGGDVVLRFDPGQEGQSEIQSGGDLLCQFPEGSNLNVEHQVGGDLRQSIPGASAPKSGEGIQIGEGGAEVRLTAGGDLILGLDRIEVESTEEVVDDILKEVDLKLAEVEARFNALGAGLYDFDADRIGERVRRAVARAQRKAEKARMRDRVDPASWGIAAGATLEGFGAPTEDISEEERLAILQMVESGKITVEEAELLLQALEGDS